MHKSPMQWWEKRQFRIFHWLQGKAYSSLFRTRLSSFHLDWWAVAHRSCPTEAHQWTMLSKVNKGSTASIWKIKIKNLQLEKHFKNTTKVHRWCCCCYLCWIVSLYKNKNSLFADWMSSHQFLMFPFNFMGDPFMFSSICYRPQTDFLVLQHP